MHHEDHCNDSDYCDDFDDDCEDYEYDDDDCHSDCDDDCNDYDDDDYHNECDDIGAIMMMMMCRSVNHSPLPNAEKSDSHA